MNIVLEDKNKKRFVFYYYLIMYLIQILWVNKGDVPLFLNYFFTILILLPALGNRSYFLFAITLFGITSELYTSNTFFVLNFVSFVGVILIFFDSFYKTRALNKMDLLLYFFLLYCLMVEFNAGSSFSFTYMPIYLRSFIWLFMISFYARDMKSIELVLLAILLSSFVLLTSHLFYNSGLDASRLTTDDLNDLDFISSKDRNYLSFNFLIAYIIILAIFLGYLKLQIIKIGELLNVIILGYFLLGIVAFSSRTIVIAAIVITFISILISFFKSKYYVQNGVKNKSIYLIIIILIFLFIAYKFGYLNLLLFRVFAEGSLEDGSGRTDIVKVFISNFENLSFVKKLFGQGYGTQYKLTGGVDTHNDYLAILSSYGFIGLLFWMLLLFSVRKNGNTSFSSIAIFAYLIASIGISPLMTFSTPIYLAVSLAYSYCRPKHVIIRS